MQSDIRRCGNRLIVQLPDELIAELGWGVGDILALTVIGGALNINRERTARDHALEIARRGMAKYHSVLEALAKS